MKNKWLIIPYSFTHFLVDFACALFMHHYAKGASDWYIFILLYNFCAFALQMPFGLLVDKWNRNAVSAAIGCCLVIVAYLTKPILMIAVIILGLGNAMFHVGAGTDVLNSSTQKASLLGIFVSPGAFGIYFGTLLGGRDMMLYQIYPVILIVAAFVILVMDYMAEHSFSSHNVEVSFDSAKSNKAAIATVCFFVVVLLRSFLGMKKFTWGGQSHIGAFLICAVVFGKATGGILADKFGIKKIAIISLAAAVVLFAFAGVPACGVLGIFFFNMTMPITLWAIAKVFKECKGFSFGMLTVALFLGLLPVYFANGVTFHTPLSTASIAFISLLLLTYGMNQVLGRKETK